MSIDTASTSADLASLLAAGERAAFHGRPASGVTALELAFEQARADGKGAEATAAAWLLGVCLEAAGKFGGSLAVLEPLVAAGTSEVPERRLFAALAASTSAAVRRQLGQHAEARQLDEAALAYGDGAPEAVFDATVGLASDAVAAEDVATATAPARPGTRTRPRPQRLVAAASAARLGQRPRWRCWWVIPTARAQFCWERYSSPKGQVLHGTSPERCCFWPLRRYRPVT